jgi:GNAT superfamily N-acetyltransferase
MITIRKAKRDDAHSIWDIRNAAIMDQCKGHYPPEALETWTGGEMTERFMDAVEQSFHVAVLDGRIVGTGKIGLESGKVDAIFVHPLHMRAGIGRLMLSHLESLALDAGLEQLSLESTLNAAAFYRACGFAGDSVAKYESPRGLSLDCVPMTKTLRENG